LRRPLARADPKIGDLGQLSYVFFFEFSDGHFSTCEEIFKEGQQKERLALAEAEGGAWVQAARLCASAKCSAFSQYACRSETAIRSRTSFMVSWMRVLGL